MPRLCGIPQPGDGEENVAHYYLLDSAHKAADTMTPSPAVVGANDDIQKAVGVLLQKRP